jgi:hypothetical protein
LRIPVRRIISWSTLTSVLTDSISSVLRTAGRISTPSVAKVWHLLEILVTTRIVALIYFGLFVRRSQCSTFKIRPMCNA